MMVSLLGMAPNMDQNALVAAIVLCVGALVLRCLQSTDASHSSQSWVPRAVFFGTPVFGLVVVLWEGLVVGEDSMALQDALNILPAVLILSLVVGAFASVFLMATQRGSTVGEKTETAVCAEPSENDFQ